MVWCLIMQKGEAGYEQMDGVIYFSLFLFISPLLQNKIKKMMITLRSEWTDGLPFWTASFKLIWLDVKHSLVKKIPPFFNKGLHRDEKQRAELISFRLMAE